MRGRGGKKQRQSASRVIQMPSDTDVTCTETVVLLSNFLKTVGWDQKRLQSFWVGYKRSSIVL